MDVKPGQKINASNVQTDTSSIRMESAARSANYVVNLTKLKESVNLAIRDIA